MSTVGAINYDFTANTADLKNKLDDVDKEVDKKSDSIEDSFKKISSAIKIGLAATGALGVAMVKSSVSAFAEYEQLTGGIETLFGKSSKQMMKYADQAYKTTGLSANKYMETATSFSASLLQGLGGDTEKAADYANKAIIAMSDNANKMGTSMESIQFAYQGFAKQNYTMLDNLKLGYGGTASEMARLVNESGVMGDSFKATAKNINEVSFDKIIDAIQVTQDRLKITGTTSKEASSTISGSFNSMKGAWEDFLVSMSGGDDIGESFKKLHDSAETWLNNIVPVARQVLNNLIDMVGELAGKARDKFRENFGGWAEIIETITVAIGAAVVVWKLWTGAIATWTTIKQIAIGVQAAFNAVMAANPIMLLVMAIAALVAGLIYFFTQTETGKQMFQGFMDFMGGVFSAIGGFIMGVVDAVGGFIDGVIQVVSPIVNFFSGIFNTIWQIIQGVFIVIVALVSWWIQSWMDIILPILAWLNDNIIKPIGNFFTGLWNGVVSSVSGFVKKTMSILGVIGGWINSNIIRPVANFFNSLWEGIKAGANGLVNAFKSIFGVIAGVVKAPINGIIGLVNGVISSINKIKVPDWVPGLGGSSPNLPKIPMLATGGIVEPRGGGSVIIAGDGGEDEWVVPESKMASLMRQVAERNRSGGDTINLNISGVFATSPAEQRRVAEQIAEQLELIKRRRMEG